MIGTIGRSEISYDVTRIIDAISVRANCAGHGHINFREDALIVKKAMVGPGTVLVMSDNPLWIIDASCNSGCRSGKIDGRDVAVKGQKPVPATLIVVSTNYSAVVFDAVDQSLDAVGHTEGRESAVVVLKALSVFSAKLMPNDLVGFIDAVHLTQAGEGRKCDGGRCRHLGRTQAGTDKQQNELCSKFHCFPARELRTLVFA